MVAFSIKNSVKLLLFKYAWAVLVYLENVQHFPHSFHACPHLWVFFSGGEQKTRADLEECMIYLRRRTHEFLSFLGL